MLDQSDFNPWIAITAWRHMMMTSKCKIPKEQEMMCPYFGRITGVSIFCESHVGPTLQLRNQLILFTSKPQEQLKATTSLSLDAVPYIKLTSLYPHYLQSSKTDPRQCRFSLGSFYLEEISSLHPSRELFADSSPIFCPSSRKSTPHLVTTSLAISLDPNTLVFETIYCDCKPKCLSEPSTEYFGSSYVHFSLCLAMKNLWRWLD